MKYLLKCGKPAKYVAKDEVDKILTTNRVEAKIFDSHKTAKGHSCISCRVVKVKSPDEIRKEERERIRAILKGQGYLYALELF